MRIILNQSEKRFVSRLMKNGQKSILLNPINSETLIRMNPNQSETKFSIQINPNQSEPGLIQTEFSIQGRNDSDWFWLKIRFGSIRDRIDSDLSGLKTWFWIGSDSFELMSQILYSSAY